MNGKYGPNTQQVSMFLDAIAQLNDEEWQQTLIRFRRSRKSAFSAIMAYFRWHAAWKAVRRGGRHEAKEASLNALRSLGFDDSHDQPPYDRMTMTGAAVFALILRDHLSVQHFRTLYDPFEELVPIP